MNCQEAKPLLSAFADGELNGEAGSSVGAHIARCPACARQAEEHRTLKGKLRAAVSTQTAPTGLETRIRSRLREQPRAVPWWQAGWPRFAGAAAGVALLTVSLWATVWRPMERQVMAALGIGAGDHVHCTLERKSPPIGQQNRPIDPEYGDLLVRVKSAMPGDYELLESHYCRWQGRRFQHIVFGRDGHKVSLIVTPKKDAEGFPRHALMAKMRQDGIPLYRARIQAVETAGFESGRNLAFVVSDLEPGENLRLLAALAPAIRERM